MTRDDLANGSVSTGEVVDSSPTDADIANGSLTFADISGSGANGTVTFNPLPAGRCYEVTLGISGATAGDAVVIVTKADMPDGVFLYGTQVPSPTTVTAVICNLSGATSPPITNMPVRVVTFHRRRSCEIPNRSCRRLAHSTAWLT